MIIKDRYDLIIIGGGINGVGIALDAAGRGLSVLLCEQDDLAFGTSSKSSKLIHGGLRYLEQYDFRLVKEALKERGILLKKAPHVITPLRFVLPHTPSLRPAWMIRLGLFLYDHLARRSLPSSTRINLRKKIAGKPLKKKFSVGFEYSDCAVDDARLVVLNAVAAREKGAVILTRTRFCEATRTHAGWDVVLQANNSPALLKFKTKCIVNAAGPWVNAVLDKALATNIKERALLVKGSHIVVPKWYGGSHAYLLQHSDQRVVFVIPFQQDYCLIGTTDVPVMADELSNITVSEAEITYLCQIVNDYFKHPIHKQNIKWQYAGVRALYEDKTSALAKISRDYHLVLEDNYPQALLLSIFGGKVTTYRRLAEKAMTLLQPYFPSATGHWTHKTTLPGGDFCEGNMTQLIAQLKRHYPFISDAHLFRYARIYGTLTYKILNDAKKITDLGEYFDAGFYEAELIYLVQNEWAITAEDILWRRTKLGLVFSPAMVERLNAKLQIFNNKEVYSCK